MRGVFDPTALVKHSSVISNTNAAATITIAADPEEYWVLRKISVSHDGDGVTDFDNLVSQAVVSVTLGGLAVWFSYIHPGNGGTGSVEFENGPWDFDFGPGLYNAVLNESLVVNVSAFGTGILGGINILYQ